MFIKTKYLDEMKIDEEKVIQFHSGIPGFTGEQAFVLLDIPGNEAVQILQSIHAQDLAFFVMNPHQFFQDYTFHLPDHIKDGLQILNEKDIVVLSVVTVQQPFSSSTLNLKAPIIMNARKMLGKQLILEMDYPLKAPLAPLTGALKGD